jgi:Cu(I)/Ag(I) efflux system membrane protein CusA/SilA
MVDQRHRHGPHVPPPEGESISWLQRLIAYCARNPLLTLVAVAALAFGGYRALINAPLDAIPDLSDVQVIIFTEWPGRSPDLVEDQITYPLTTTLLAAPGVNYVRGQSFFGLSFVYVIFDDGVDMYWARSRVLEYLNSATADLPEGVNPTLGPDATGVGWVYQYALKDTSGNHSLDELRALQDFNLRYGSSPQCATPTTTSAGASSKSRATSSSSAAVATCARWPIWKRSCSRPPPAASLSRSRM